MHFKKNPTIVKAAPSMPNVFITPPEEDDAPAWCCFDAANPSLSQVIERERPEPQDMTPIFDEEPRFYYSAVESHTVGTPMKTSIVDAAIGKRGFVEEDDIDIETISDYGHELEEEDQEREPTSRDLANDSDVVEVVKVRRRKSEYQNGGPPVEQQPAPVPIPNKTKSLKSRASSAFKTLTGSLRSKRRNTSSSLGSSSRSSHDRLSIDQQPATKPLRRGSGILSQLFKSASPVDVGVDLPCSSAQLDITQDQLRLSASSPTPSTASRISSRLSLRNLFSFNDERGSETRLPAPILTSVPVEASASSSTTSPVWPETPTSAEYQLPSPLPLDSTIFDQTHNLDLGIGLGLSINPTKANSTSNLTSASMSPPTTPRKSISSVFTSSSMSTRKSTSSTVGSVWGSITPKLQRRSKSSTSAAIGSPRSSSTSMGVVNEEDADPDPVGDGDTSLEIRLDSFHFDSMSFDVDRFNLQ